MISPTPAVSSTSIGIVQARASEIRKAVPAPVIFVTSRDSGSDEVRALSLGGDDYITKPYSVPVLLARVKAVLRRIYQFEAECSAEVVLGIAAISN